MRAEVVLVTADREITLGAIGAGTPCDMELVERLLRLVLEVVRQGWTIRLVEVDGDLRALLDLVGVSDRLGLGAGGG